MLFKNFIAKLIILYFLLLILFPLPLFKVLKYGFSSAYLALISLVFLLPVIFFLSKSYWGNKVTIILWCLRIFMAIIFLLVSYRLEITLIGVISFAGTLFLTFFYELGYFVLSIGYFKKFLKYWTWLNMVTCIFLLSIALSIIFKYNFVNFIEQSNTLKIYYPSWPNYFGIYLILLFWLVVYFGQRNKKYFFSLLFIFPTLFFTFSRTTFLALLVSIFFGIFLKRKKFFIPAVLILILLVSTGYILFKIKEAAGFGTSLSHTIVMRQLRWKAALSYYQEHPFLGSGFRSFTEEVPEFSYSDSRLISMGSSHNDYIDLLIRGGLLYSLAFWLFVLYLVWQGFIKKNDKVCLLKYLSYSIIALLVSAIFQNPFKDPFILALFWSYVAAIAYYSKFNGKKFELRNENL